MGCWLENLAYDQKVVSSIYLIFCRVQWQGLPTVPGTCVNDFNPGVFTNVCKCVFHCMDWVSIIE